MKNDIHPTYYANAKAECACGNTFSVGSVFQELSVELCSACHPFYTGKQKLVDTARRVEKFQERSAKKADTPKRSKKAKTAERKAKKTEK